MKKLLHVIFNRKLQFFFLSYIILLLPILVFSIAENVSFFDKWLLLGVNILLFFTLSILFSFSGSRLEKILYLILFIISLAPSLIYIGYLLFAKVFLQYNSIISLFETNPEESREFIVHYFSKWLIVGQSIYILLCLFIIIKMKKYKPIKLKEHKSLFITSLIIFLILVAIPTFSKQIYFVNFFKTYVDYKLQRKYEKETIAHRQSLKYDVEFTKRGNLPKTIVVVIGESLTRTHMSLYGYKRKTSERLELLGDSLLVYQNVVSPQVHTIPVLRSTMTLSEKDHPEYITEKPSLFELFNRAGFETYFISNQPFSENSNSSYDVFFELAKHKYNLSLDKQTDGIVLPALDEILTTDTTHNKLIVIHLIGNHMAYEFRYTPEFNVFDYTEDNVLQTTKYRDAKACKTVDRYDNSVLYNDYIISTMISMLKNEKGTDAGLIYFSDHGEEVYDFRNFTGHAYEKVTSYMCQIPFLVWMSEGYKRDNPDLEVDLNRPFSTQDFLYSLSDFAGINYPDYNDSRSLFSSKFKESKRYIGNLTYQEVLDKSK